MVDFVFNRKVSPVIITTPSEKEAMVQQIYDAVKDWSDEPINLIQRSIISGAGKEDLGGGTKVGLTITLLNAQQSFGQRVTSESEGSATTGDTNGEKLIDTAATFIADGVSPGDAIINFTDKSVGTVLEVISEIEIDHMPLEDGSDDQWEIGDAYKIWPVVQCEVSGGNLVAIDGNGDPMSPIFPTPFTQIILARSSSATQSDIEAIRYASFQNGVHLDPNATHKYAEGTEYPSGNSEYPVNNLADAKVIAVENGLDILHICAGDFTLGPTDNIDGYTLRGNYRIRTVVTIESGCSTEKTIFEYLGIDGELSGKTVLYRVGIGNLTGFKGVANTCVLQGNIALAGDASFLSCYSGVPGSGTPILDTNGYTFQIRGYNGNIEIRNVNDLAQKGSIDFNAGKAILHSSVSDGQVVIRSADEITRNDPGTADIQIYDSAAMEDKLTKALGLIGHNQRLFDMVYDNYGNMTSGTLRLYETAADCEAEKNHIAEYNITGTFTGLNKATLIKQKLA